MWSDIKFVFLQDTHTPLVASVQPAQSAPVPALILTVPTGIDPTSALRAYFFSPEFLLEHDLAVTGMHQFDDCVRQGLDPTTGDVEMVEWCDLDNVRNIPPYFIYLSQSF